MIAFAVVTAGLNAQDPAPQTPATTVSVNEVATKPGEHVGSVQLVGVVIAVVQGKGFVLVDPREFAACGFGCLTEPSTKKIPVGWSGEAPKLEQVVRVAGTLSHGDKGWSLVAGEVDHP